MVYLDLETIGAVRVWPGCRTYAGVPVQFSCYVEDGWGGLVHLSVRPAGKRETWQPYMCQYVRLAHLAKGLGLNQDKANVENLERVKRLTQRG